MGRLPPGSHGRSGTVVIPAWEALLLAGGAALLGMVLGYVITRWDQRNNLSAFPLEHYTTGMGQRLLVHAKTACDGWCPIHAPTVHHMAAWPTAWNSGRKFMERVCEHGVHHPDPDDLLIRTIPSAVIHKCDGCCRREKVA